MFFTPKAKRLDTVTTQYSSNLSRGNNKNTTQSTKQFLNNSSIMHSGSNKNIEKLKPIAKLSVQIKKKKYSNTQQTLQSPKIRVNPSKYRPNLISKMSSKQHDNIIAYGVTTLKGYKNVVNPHFVGINLGPVKNISLSQAFDGELAAKIIKQQLNLQINQLQQEGEQSTQKIMNETYNRLQQKIMKKQNQIQDNSGSSLLSVIIKKQLITVSNAGCSYAFCGTKNGSFLKLAQSHTTLNKNQMQRIIKNGATVYQTVVNVPYQQQLELQGPARISPSGLMLTRCLGRSYDYKQQFNNLSHRCYNPQQLTNITWKPQIKYINTEQVLWLGIFSQSIINNCSLEHIHKVINSQLKKKNQNWTQHNIAMEITKKIVQKLASEGVADAMSAIIVIIGQLTAQKKQYVLRLDQKLKNQRKNRISEQSQTYSRKSTLSYRGNRRSFVKSISPNIRKASYTQMINNSIQKNNAKRNLTKDFSFNNFN